MTLTSQAMNKVNTTAQELNASKGNRKNAIDDSLNAVGFDSLFANAMVSGQSQRNLQGLQEALQGDGSPKAAPVAQQPPVSFAALNGVAGAVQAAMSTSKADAPNTQSSNATMQNRSSDSALQKSPAPPKNTQNAAAEQSNSAEPAKANTEKTSAQADSSKAANAAASNSPNVAASASANKAANTEAANKLDTSATQAAAQAGKATASQTGVAKVGNETPTVDATGSKVAATGDTGAAEDKTKLKFDGQQTIRTEGTERTSDTDVPKTNRSGRADLSAQDKLDAKGAAQQRADFNPNAVGAQATASQARQLQSGDKKLVTAGLEGKPSVNATNQAAVSLQPGTRGDTVAKTDIKTPVNQPGFAKELGQKINWAIGKNMSTVDIRVNPEQMGTLNMRILQKGQNLQIIIRTSDENSNAMLQQAIGGLKETMAQSGLQLNQVQIHSGSQGSAQNPFGQANQGQAGQDQNSNGQQSGQGRSGGEASTQGTQTEETAESAATARRPDNPNSNLDLFA